MNRPIAPGDAVTVRRWDTRATVTLAGWEGAARVVWWETEAADGAPPVVGVAAWYPSQPAPVIPVTPGVAA